MNGFIMYVLVLQNHRMESGIALSVLSNRREKDKDNIKPYHSFISL